MKVIEGILIISGVVFWVLIFWSLLFGVIVYRKRKLRYSKNRNPADMALGKCTLCGKQVKPKDKAHAYNPQTRRAYLVHEACKNPQETKFNSSFGAGAL